MKTSYAVQGLLAAVGCAAFAWHYEASGEGFSLAWSILFAFVALGAFLDGVGRYRG